MNKEPLKAEFADILRQLSPETVAFLNRCFEGLNRNNSDPEAIPTESYLGGVSYLFYGITGEHAGFGTSPDLFELADGIIRHAISLGLVDGSFAVPGERLPNADEFYMTPLGKEFVQACRAAGAMGKSTA